MTSIRRLFSLCVLVLALFFSGGCGKDTDRNGRDEEYKLPDELVAQRQKFGLTVDEYHPGRGGVMANDRIELRYPPSPIAGQIANRIFGEALAAYELATDYVGRPAQTRVVVRGTRSMDDYLDQTGKQWWYYAMIRGDTIICTPFEVMMQRHDPITVRSISMMGLEQKMVQMALDRVSGGAIPIWLREAVASYIADERPVLRAQVEEFRLRQAGFWYSPGLDELEYHLHVADDRVLTRSAFFFAYRMLERLLERVKIEEAIGFARLLGEGRPLDDASIEAFGMPYLDLVASIRPADLFDGAGEVDTAVRSARRRNAHE